MEPKKWTVIGAASVLGLGLAAGGAVTAANALTLRDGSAEIAHVADVSIDGAGGQTPVITPSPSPSGHPGAHHSSPSAPTAPTASSAPSAPSAASVPSPASPPSAPSAPSPTSAPSAPSPASPPSAPSVPSVH